MRWDLTELVTNFLAEKLGAWVIPIVGLIAGLVAWYFNNKKTKAAEADAQAAREEAAVERARAEIADFIAADKIEKSAAETQKISATSKEVRDAESHVSQLDSGAVQRELSEKWTRD